MLAGPSLAVRETLNPPCTELEVMAKYCSARSWIGPMPNETASRSRVLGTPLGRSRNAGWNPPAESTKEGLSPKRMASSSSPERLSWANPSMPTNESRSRARISRNFSCAS